MNTPQIISSLIGLTIGASIFWLIRRDYLMHRDGIKWMGIAVAILLLGFFPGWIDYLGARLNIGYPQRLAILEADLGERTQKDKDSG